MGSSTNLNILNSHFVSLHTYIANKPNISINQNYGLLLNSTFIPLFDNFYLANVISKSSITMGKCSTQFYFKAPQKIL
jgi:hypothetical protein